MDIFQYPEVLVALVSASAGVLVAIWADRVARRLREAPASATIESQEAPRGETPALLAFRAGLAKTRQLLAGQLSQLFRDDRAKWFEDLEEALVLADVGIATSKRLLDALRRRPGLNSPEAMVAALREEVRRLLGDVPAEAAGQPLVILVVGVNGVGKTTTIGKLAHRYQKQGKQVLVAAGDTFRAAAAEQLEIWAQRVGCQLVRHQAGADPSGVAFDGVKAARARNMDVAIVDTAGRLHVKVNLMEELKKIVRVIGREMPGAPHETWLVLDATTGQNALSQARQFRDALPLSGIVLTKLDGTAKGGAVLAIRSELGVPVRYVGLGERLEDLRPFDPDAFVAALLGDPAGSDGA